MTILHNPGAPRVLNSISPSRLELTLLLIKERKKKLRYLGSYLQHYNDRAFLYNGMGGLKGTKFIIERHHHRAQYCHPTLHSERYDIRTVKIKGSEMNNMVGNFTRNTWDCSIASDNLLQDGAFRRQLTAIHQEEAIELLEGWGVKYILLDEIRKPTVQDSIYVRHNLYTHKFPYIPDPVTNAYYGDADWKWKGNEKIDYSNYGASTKDERNSFQSLWSIAEKAAAKVMAMPGRSTGTAPKSPPPTPTPAAGASKPTPAPTQAAGAPKPTATPTPAAGAPKPTPAPTPAAGAPKPTATPTPAAGAPKPTPTPTPAAGAPKLTPTPTPAAGASKPTPAPTPAAGASKPTPAPTPAAGAPKPTPTPTPAAGAPKPTATPTPAAGAPKPTPAPTPAAGAPKPTATPTPAAGAPKPTPTSTPAAGAPKLTPTPTPAAGASKPTPAPTPAAGASKPTPAPTPAAGAPKPTPAPTPTPAAGAAKP